MTSIIYNNQCRKCYGNMDLNYHRQRVEKGLCPYCGHPMHKRYLLELYIKNKRKDKKTEGNTIGKILFLILFILGAYIFIINWNNQIGLAGVYFIVYSILGYDVSMVYKPIYDKIDSDRFINAKHSIIEADKIESDAYRESRKDYLLKLADVSFISLLITIISYTIIIWPLTFFKIL